MTAVQERTDAGAPVEQVDAPPALVRRRRRTRPVDWVLRAASLAAAVLLWWLLTTYDVVAWLRFDQLPGPGAVLSNVAYVAGWRGSSLDYLDDYLRTTRRGRAVVDRVFWGE